MALSAAVAAAAIGAGLVSAWHDWTLRNELRAWAIANALPLATTDPKEPLDDLLPLHAILSGASVVGLGEATHGTREFFLLKHRLVRFLVEREGFTVFAIEASLPEAEAINRYVTRGEGDPRKALAGLHFWTWDTYEVLELIEWIREWNTNPEHSNVKFYGFDSQHSARAALEVQEYLRKVEFSSVRIQTVLDTVGRLDAAPPGLPLHEVESIRSGIRELQLEFDRNRSEWSSLTGEMDWEWSSRCAEILRQSWEIRNGSVADRDRLMAENILWIADREHGAKVAVWAHNGHVERSSGKMGKYLQDELGPGYAVVGFAFGEGVFRAKPSIGSLEVANITASARDAAEFDGILLDVAYPLFALHLADAPKGLDRPISMREFGGVAVNTASSRIRNVVRAFDILIFVRESTAARPTPTGVRPRPEIRSYERWRGDKRRLTGLGITLPAHARSALSSSPLEACLT